MSKRRKLDLLFALVWLTILALMLKYPPKIVIPARGDAYEVQGPGRGGGR